MDTAPAIANGPDEKRPRRDNPAAALGRLCGKRTAERGPDYFRKIEAMRKTKSGGRPKKADKKRSQSLAVALALAVAFGRFRLGRFRHF